ncbi:CB1 cannabinoid receptor-interacting protein 1-like [Paramacrobiotus metropolitanus]|uniref:CB1 cannabinoid receptor-interacting protein 1-like n=1 Tax=Paramacrobiotus metropolitanus TaxID=2943436 RepID=UPI00244609C3|nr:CB1 cannabinoid receptor-interacting protein 1-like [Paramacrobiotus metropolitanus]
MASYAGKTVKLTFNIKRESDGIPIYFKADGQRFEQQLTIKLQRDETYRIDLTVRPAIPIEILRLQDENIGLEKISKFIDPNALSYTGVWKTAHFPLTEKNKRELIKITVVMKAMPMFSAMMQCKFYENTDAQHARWGDKLTNLEYDGVVTSDGTIVVQKQQII